MALLTPTLASPARSDWPSSPQCTQCRSSQIECIVTMRHETVDADAWFHCEECGHIFTDSAVDQDEVDS